MDLRHFWGTEKWVEDGGGLEKRKKFPDFRSSEDGISGHFDISL